jgi:TetR/AcrR family transcriptional repressor of nem operon
MLSAEISSLPNLVALEVRRFFEVNVAWLTAVFSRQPGAANDGHPESAESEAALFMASLEGALIVAKGLGEPEIFDKIAEAALQRYS